MGRKIKMTASTLGAHDHIFVAMYHQDTVYEVGANNSEPLPDDALEGALPAIHPMSDSLAEAFLAQGVAEEVTPVRAIKPGPSETK